MPYAASAFSVMSCAASLASTSRPPLRHDAAHRFGAVATELFGLAAFEGQKMKEMTPDAVGDDLMDLIAQKA